MTDEKFCFVSDLREKKKTATGAHHKRTHCGKGGAVKFPSDFMTKKELKNMSGEVQAYRLNDPMKWDEFRAMPEDLQVSYVKLLRERFDAPDGSIGKMMGADKDKTSRYFKKIGLRGETQRGKRGWNKEAWLAFVHGVPTESKASLDPVEETFAPVPVEVKTLPKMGENPVQGEKQKAVPYSGTLSFTGRVEDVLNTVAVLVGGGKCPYHNYMGTGWCF